MKGWKTLIFNLLLVIAPPALAYLASVNWTDYLNPTWAPVVVGIVGIALRAVTNSPMKFVSGPVARAAMVIVALPALLAFTLSAMAADLPVKAKQPTSPFLTTGGSGFYWGVGTTSAVDQSSVNGNVFVTSLASSNLTAAGQSVDLEAGYIWGNASLAGFGNWARVYASGSYQNVSGGISVPGNSASIVSRWSAQQGLDVNADLLQTILSAINLGNFSFPTFTPQLPSNIAVASGPRQYLGGFVTEFGLGGSFGQASGTSWAVAPGIRSGFLWQVLDKTGKPNGTALDMGVSVDWPTRGVSFDNVFAPGGAPLVSHAGVNMGTQYKAYIRYDF